ncbi:SHOCT domain-containing protein [Eggerthella sinensis]|uniref:SHOCT domain-containing protein n=1 Tax=Eggerthella sinensis TaxID=242230 RepID=UPI00266D71AC|nr:SHOCT domain-containing protein [Eggerthella sinensis]
MKILGMGFPEMLIILCTMAIPILIVVVIVRAIMRRRNPVDETQRASAAAYQRLSQLDDLRKRGVISEEEFEAKKQEIMADL